MRLRISLFIVVLIAYGSLYPFSLKVPEPHGAAWIRLFTDWSWSTSKADALGNFALFFPLGFAGVFAVATRLSLQITLTTLMSFALAVLLQAAQLYLPARTAALADVYWNMIGMSAGISAGVLVRSRPTAQRVRWQAGAVLPLGVMALWFAAELLPFVPSLDVQTIKESVKALLHPTIVIEQLAFHAAGAAITGWALATIVGEARSLNWLLVVVCATALGKAIIVTRTLDVSTLCGLALGCGIWFTLLRCYDPGRSQALVLVLFVAYALNALLPFRIRIDPQPFRLLPFAGLLNGSMLLNSQTLAANLCLYAGILGVFRINGASPVSASFALALLVGLFEALQIHLVGRTPDITDPLLVLILGQTIAAMPLSDREQGSRSSSSPSQSSGRPTPNTLDGQAVASFSFFRWGLGLMAICLAMAFPVSAILRLSQLPYNVSELFLGNGSFPFIVIFAIALLWIGAGARIVAYHVAMNSRPYLLFPLLAFGAGIVSLILLCLSVTQESISDITGSNNLHWFVINKDIWGTAARRVFLLIPGAMVSFFERPVRYAALYGPLVTFLALLFVAVDGRRSGYWCRRNVILLLVSAGLWLWMCKAIAFDWSSTDNLNELIARDGPWGWGGGGYLYALLALVCANAVLLARMPSKIIWFAISALVTFALLPIGWWLINQGLEQQVHKYELVFSGVQFLLGPDRKNLLSTKVLFLRWCLVQLGGVLTIAFGARLAQPVIAWQASRDRK